MAVVKSSILLGLGEEADEVLSVLDELRGVGCNSIVLGQYLRPTPLQVPVLEYIRPERFEAYRPRGARSGLFRGRLRSACPHELPRPPGF